MAIIEGLQNWRMNTPKLFGGFHIIFLLLIFSLVAIMIHFFKDAKERTMKRIVLICWIILVVFELGKQLIYWYSDGTWQYQWYQFPFQFCETPMYVIPFLLFIKNERIKNAILHFLSTFAFFAGFALVILPISLYTSNVFLNIRTMVQHGIQVILGLYLFAWNRKNASIKSFFEGSYIFLIVLTIAVILNFTVGKVVPNFNMFYVSKDYDSIISIVKYIKPYVPWFVFLLAYTLGFYFCAFASYLVEFESYRISVKLQLKREAKVECEN